MKFPYFLILILVLLSSCSEHYGNKIQGGELTVFYTDDSDIDLAKQIALFWKENDLLTGSPQDLQLTGDKDRYILKMIASDYKKESFELNIDEKMVLLQLQKKLNAQLLSESSKILEIEITKNNFETIENINE